MKVQKRLFLIFFGLTVLLTSCVDQQKSKVAKGVFDTTSEPSEAASIDLADIQSAGELIVLTLYGPATIAQVFALSISLG